MKEEKEHILIIEDDEPFLKTLTNLLERQGYRISGAKDGPEAIETAKKESFALIVADVRLPGGMDGVEVIRRIKEIQPKATGVVIIITGYADENAPVRAIKVGVDDYIYKPFKTEEFLHSVEHNLAIYRLEKERERHKEIIEKMNKELEDRVEQRTKEMKDAQVQLVQAAKMAAFGQLGAGIAHEVNNPLGGILGYAQFILGKLKRSDFGIEDFKDCQRYIEYIEKESSRCKTIVENLLKFSGRPISDKPVSVEIKRVIEETLSLIGRQLSIQNIKIATDFDPELAEIKGNPNQLQQVFLNLILNAQQAMPKGGDLRIQARNKGPKEIEIEFADTGCGIAKEHLDKVFEPFFTTKEKEKAVGIGLSISQQIIRDHQGTIEVKSEVDKGTTFTIILPSGKV